MLKGIIIASLITGILPAPPSARPSNGYESWYGEEIKDNIINDILNGENNLYLDYNADGKENIADAVGVWKRYEDNVRNMNEYTFGESEALDIALENVPLDTYDYFYYEIDGKSDSTISTWQSTRAWLHCELKTTSNKWEILDFDCVIDPCREMTFVIAGQNGNSLRNPLVNTSSTEV